MKQLFFRFLAAAFVFAGLSASAQKHKGPSDSVLLFCFFKGNGDGLHLASSTDGYKWEPVRNDSVFLKPAVGKDKLMRDPCIIRGGDGKFHMVWTVSWKEKGIGYAASSDLIHWSEQKYLPVMEHEPGARNSWAPEITYDPKTKQYMIYWATTIDGRFPLTDTSSESKYNHRIYYTLTRDFKTFSPTQLLFDPGFNIIDATIVPDNNRYVMFLKNETLTPLEKNIRIAYASKLTGPYSTPSQPITGHWVEGPTSVKMGNRWIVYFDKYREHAYGAVTSTDLENWTDISSQVSLPKGIRHGSVFKVSRKEFERLMQ